MRDVLVFVLVVHASDLSTVSSGYFLAFCVHENLRSFVAGWVQLVVHEAVDLVCGLDLLEFVKISCCFVQSNGEVAHDVVDHLKLFSVGYGLFAAFAAPLCKTFVKRTGSGLGALELLHVLLNHSSCHADLLTDTVDEKTLWEGKIDFADALARSAFVPNSVVCILNSVLFKFSCALKSLLCLSHSLDC